MHTAHTVAIPSGVPPFKLVSTEGIKASERREFWEEGAGFLFGTLRVEIQNRVLFNANFEHTSISDLVFCRLSAGTPHRVFRTEAVARNDNRAFVKAVLQLEGSSIIEQDGRSTALRAGEWSIYDAERPYSVIIPKRSVMSILLVPRDRVVARNFDIGRLILRRLSGRHGLGKVIWSLIGTTFDQRPAIEERSSHEVADIVAQMLRLALLDFPEERLSVNPRDALRDRVKQYVAGHLDDPELSIAKLAGVANCTKRYLHMVFESEQISLSSYILKLRLERCREDLLNPALGHKSITDIAYSWGFNNSNHFSRAFKRAFGVSPRDARLDFAPALAEVSGRHLPRVASRVI
jgi:AraC-like DNA-binding protein